MTAIRIAIILAVIGDLLCLWLLINVTWYNFSTFMLVTQPLLLVAVLLFVGVLIREIRIIRKLRERGGP
jgi:hypothetical protein